MIKKLFQFTVKDNCIDDFEKLLSQLSAKTNIKENPIFYGYTKSGNVFFVVEIWRNKEDFQKHIETEHLKAFRTNRSSFVLKIEDFSLKS